MTDHDRRARLAFELEAAVALADALRRTHRADAFLSGIAVAGIGKPGSNGGLSAYGVDAGHNGMGPDVLVSEWRTAAMLKVATLRAEMSLEA